MQKYRLVEITKNHPIAMMVMFVTSFFVGILAILFILTKASLDFVEAVIATATIITNLAFSIWLVFGDYRMFLSDTQEIVFKSGTKSYRFSEAQFEAFRVTPIHAIFSSSYKYFYLHVDSRKFRIRYYIEDYGLFNPFQDLNKEARAIEVDIRMRVNKFLADSKQLS